AKLVPSVDQRVGERLDVAVHTARVGPGVRADDCDSHRMRFPRNGRDWDQTAELRTPTDTQGYRTRMVSILTAIQAWFVRGPGDGHARAHEQGSDDQEQGAGIVRERARQRRGQAPNEPRPRDPALAEPRPDSGPSEGPGQDARHRDPEHGRIRVTSEAVRGEAQAALQDVAKLI